MSDDDTSKRIEELKKLQENIDSIVDFALDDYYKNCIDSLQQLSELRKKNPDSFALTRDHFVVGHLAVLYRLTIKHRKTLRALNKALEQLPQREEFNELRGAIQAVSNEQDAKLADTQQKVNDTLGPINDFLKKLKESQQGSGNDIYG